MIREKNDVFNSENPEEDKVRKQHISYKLLPTLKVSLLVAQGLDVIQDFRKSNIAETAIWSHYEIKKKPYESVNV